MTRSVMAWIACLPFSLLAASLAAQPTPSANLSVEFIDPPVFVDVGAIASLTVRFRNNGPSPAVSPWVYIAYPTFTPGGSVVAPAGWQCSQPSVPPTIPPALWGFACTTSAFAPGAADFSFRLPMDFPLGYRVDVEALAESATADPDVSDNRSALRIIAGAPLQTDLAINVEGPRLPVRSGEDLRWSIRVSNSGPAPAHGFELYWSELVSQAYAVTIPPGWSCQRAVLGNGFQATYRCTTPSMSAGSTVEFQLARTVILANGAEQRFGAIFSVMAPADLVEENNADEASTWVAGGGTGAAELAIDMRPTSNPHVFDVVASNAGPLAAERAFVSFDFANMAGAPVITAAGWDCRYTQPVFYPPLVDRLTIACFRQQLPAGVHALRVDASQIASSDFMRVMLSSAANESNLEDNVVNIGLAASGAPGVPVPALSPFGVLLLLAGIAAIGLISKRG